MEKSILDSLTPDDLPVLLPSHPDDMEVSEAGTQGEELTSESPATASPLAR